MINGLNIITPPLRSFPNIGKSGEHEITYNILPKIVKTFKIMMISFMGLVLSAYFATTEDSNVGRI